MRVLESAIYAENLDETAAFYADVLGLERIAAAEGRHVFFRAGDGPGQCVVLIFRPSATQEPPAPDARVPVPPHGATWRGASLLCRHAPTRSNAGARASSSAGVAIEADFEWPQGGRSIYFRDPAGNSIEMAEPRIWGLDPGRVKTLFAPAVVGLGERAAAKKGTSRMERVEREGLQVSAVLAAVRRAAGAARARGLRRENLLAVA